MFNLLINIYRCTLREGDAVGAVESLEAHLTHADAQFYRYESPQDFAVLARIERRWRQLVPSADGIVLVERERSQPAHLPDQVVGGLQSEPRLQHVPDAEALTLTSEEAPRALQPLPELHKAFLGIIDVHSS